MDNNKSKLEQNEHQENAQFVASTASTSRRAVTAVLVLVAALLLGYVLYDVLLSHPTETQVVEQSAPVNESSVEEGSVEYSEAEKTAILEAMSEAEVELTPAEVDERRAILGAMDTDSDDETSAEERKAILEAMQ